MKYILLIACLFFTTAAIGQTRLIRAELVNGKIEFEQYAFDKTITITDGLVYKYIAESANDTAHYFYPGTDRYETTVTFKKIVVVPKPDIVTDIDDVVQATNVYTPSANLGTNVNNATGWSHMANNVWNANHFNKTVSYAFPLNATIEVIFDGYKVEWYTEKRNNHGIAGIKIDGGQEVEVDLYDTRTDNNSTKAWTSPDLPIGQHKITIRLTGKKNPAATDSNIIHDYFKIYKKQ